MNNCSFLAKTAAAIQITGCLRTAFAARLLPFLLLLVLPAVVQAQFTFTTNYNGTINLWKYTGPGGVVIIPDTFNGLPVTSVGGGAFADNHGVTSVVIPNSVTTIWNEVFQNCTSMTNVTIPDSVTSIGNWAFVNCTNLTGIMIPNSLTNIGFLVFDWCTGLATITVDTNNPAFSSLDGILFNRSQTTLIEYPQGKAGNFTVPESVTNIADDAFGACTHLTNVIIGNSVITIGSGAFYRCTNLASIAIPNSVTSIGYDEFSFCSSLTNITIGNSVPSIGEDAFYSCTSLASITIPNSVTNIGMQAFDLCAGLTMIMVDTNNPAFSSVGGALYDKGRTLLIKCPEGKAGSFIIPDGVISIGDGAFSYCTRLTSVTIPNSVTSIEIFAFGYCSSLTKVALPDSIASLGSYAFSYCTSLTNITIPNRVANIEDHTFESCTNLTGAFFMGNAPGVGLDVFYNDNSAVVYYLPGTTGWASTLDGRPTAPGFLPNPVILDNSPSFGVRTNRFGFIISWATNTHVVVEACTTLSQHDWRSLGTKTLIGGSLYFSDPDWTRYRVRFYRVRSR